MRNEHIQPWPALVDWPPRNRPLAPGESPRPGRHRVPCSHCGRFCECVFDVPACLCDECHAAGHTPGVPSGCRKCTGGGE